MMITKLVIRCNQCDVEQTYFIPGDFGETITGLVIYHKVCGGKMDCWMEAEVE